MKNLRSGANDSRHEKDKNCRYYKKTLQSLVDEVNSLSRLTVKGLHDPRQTHAVYGIINDKDEISQVKAHLKENGAKYFREVKSNNKEYVILCFNASNMIDDFTYYNSYN